MSYCRFSSEESGINKSDVYMYQSVSGGVVCCACRLGRGAFADATLPTWRAAINHLLAHRRAGHRFPDRALVSLFEEMKNDPDSMDLGYKCDIMIMKLSTE